MQTPQEASSRGRAGEEATGACFRRLSKLPCWDLLLLSRTGMHPLGWHHSLASDPRPAPPSMTALWLQTSKHLSRSSPTGLKVSCLPAWGGGAAGGDKGRRSLTDPDSWLRWWWWGVPHLNTPLPLSARCETWPTACTRWGSS